MRTPETVHLWGETLCLDFANSVDWSAEEEHVDADQTDVLRTADMLARWGERVGLLGNDVTPTSTAELGRARELRDAIYRLFAAIGRLEEPADADLDLLMRSYHEAVDQGFLVEREGCYQLDWRAQDPRRVRYAVATDAIGLLRDSERLRRVSHCPGRGCGWLFLNMSGRRRWCSMSTCGSREKMRRLYRRRTRHTG
ncbi:MAG TPA: ABATE domain-containing protein [Thermoleophilaceae bacterium]|nr:ABATE domain-containing protein [Thermoleophilaceae bacterium]